MKAIFTRKLMICGILILLLFQGNAFSQLEHGDTAIGEKEIFSLKGFEDVSISNLAREKLVKNGFVVTPGYKNEIYDIYFECKEQNQPIFVTTDLILHTSHIFLDYMLRILEEEQLYDAAFDLTDKMLDLSIEQYEQAKDIEVKEAARLNIGFFAVAKKLFNPEYKIGYALENVVDKEISNIRDHVGLKFRELLTYVKNPNLIKNPYAYEDYAQYVPRGHYTRNEKFMNYFKVMMWYGRIDFKLRPASKEPAITHGKKMTIQAILMTDALVRSREALRLWKMIYEPTVYFVGKTDDLCAEDYIKLIKVFPPEGTVDRYNDKAKLSHFIDKAIRLSPPKILSGAAFVEDGEFAVSTKGFRFMGQRFIPDSYIFQELVYGIKGKKEVLKYTGKGKPFTMEFIPNVGPARAFPCGLDILAVLGSKRALEILVEEGDTEYSYYDDQLNKLKKEFYSRSIEEWKQNLYWRCLYGLRPLLEKRKNGSLPEFMLNRAWTNKEIQTVLGSWTELRHDTILYAKQSYAMMMTALPARSKFTYGYVEPYPEVYGRLEEMMRDLRVNFGTLDMLPKEVAEKIRFFEAILTKLKIISERELNNEKLTDEEYRLIWNIGTTLASMKEFPPQIIKKITSNTDTRIDIIADVHTDPNTRQVLEEGIGNPFNIYVIVEDAKGRRLCRGGVFSYYEFKHPMKERLTDEKWQEMGTKGLRASQPVWVDNFVQITK